MYNLEQYILKQQRAESCPPPAEGCIASATSTLTSSTPGQLTEICKYCFKVASSGIGRPRVILGTSGQCYILASRLTCKVCKKYWQADKPQWLEKLPQRFSNIVPAFLTHKKAV
ncbi:E3 ubiquitin-protein ligase CIP8 [Dissostichus eleginoides]|uniref:E3 ubiquitin-protein ligase CIP8 n=1 Tax=Dissostichus eleginoides TaxID=100907 RepID=A0AAD9BHR1_DISEL|nr:E3 ubiquitin-protein ligase CIP8 [Dissostichus eleginoides]